MEFRGIRRLGPAESLDRLGNRPLFDGDALLRAHVDSQADNGHALWDLVVLAQWYETLFE